MKKIIASGIAFSLFLASCGSKEKATNEIPKVEVIPVKLESLHEIRVC